MAALARPARYIGAIGSRKTSLDRAERLRQQGVADEQLARIHAPIGLNIGGRTPEEVALSIAAEIIAVRRGPRPAMEIQGAGGSSPPRRVALGDQRAEVGRSGQGVQSSGRFSWPPGTSSRLGEPKQLLSFRGKPLVRQVAEHALASRLAGLTVVVGNRAAEVTAASPVYRFRGR